MAVSKVQPKVAFTTPVQASKGALKTSAAKKEVTTATPSVAKTIAKYAVAALAVSAAAYGANAAYQAFTAVAAPIVVAAPSFSDRAVEAVSGFGLGFSVGTSALAALIGAAHVAKKALPAVMTRGIGAAYDMHSYFHQALEAGAV